MSPDEIRGLRGSLGLSFGELAEAVGTDVTTLLRWESGDLFPTKVHAERLRSLLGERSDERPAVAASHPRGPEPGALDPLSDPALWAIFRKLLAHPKLLADVAALAAPYEDPTRT